jgi:two-component system sensor histidine kinase AlgZ
VPTATDNCYLPDFCTGRAVAVVIVVCQLLAFVLVAAQVAALEPAGIRLLKVSLFLHWLGLTSAGVLCLSRARLAARSTTAISVGAFALIVATTLLLSLAAWYALIWIGYGHELGATDLLIFAARNAAVAAIVGAVLLRYLWIQHEWRRNVELEAGSRIQALTARIRPHFLFNSMNTIAALIRSRPADAERAVEDLADLFRASLADAGTLVPLAEELELTRLYARLEDQRLGERLRVEWSIASPLPSVRLPRLVLQPLLENAIRHGIEPIPGGGMVEVQVHEVRGALELEVRNPLAPNASVTTDGNRMALENIRQRLELAYGGRARLETSEADGRYRATLRLPLEAR